MPHRGEMQKPEAPPDPSLMLLLDRAWDLSRSHHGDLIALYVPGMFVVDGKRGKYRAVSITGERCELGCEHCKGSLLTTMPPTPDAESLLKAGFEAAERGDVGMLVTGGCDARGRLPWERFLEAIRTLKTRTNLTITVHAGMVTPDQARGLKESGVDQALVDVIGDDETWRRVCHLPEGIGAIRRTLDLLVRAGVEIVPHILFGIHYGEQRGEAHALRILQDYPLRRYVIVVLIPTRGTPMGSVLPPSCSAVAEFIARARMAIPERLCSLGCARPRGRYRRDLERLAVWAGVNSIALPSEEAIEEALRRGLTVKWKETCCSLD